MKEPLRSADQMVEIILNTPGVLDQLKTQPEQTLKKIAEVATKQLPPPAMVADVWIYRIVTAALSGVAIIAIGGAIYLSATAGSGETVKIPDALTALGAAAIGALAGLLAPSPSGK